MDWSLILMVAVIVAVGSVILSGVGIVDNTTGLVVLSIAVVVVCVFASVPLPSSEEAVVAGVVLS